mgnify:CR=1 FL=1
MKPITIHGAPEGFDALLVARRRAEVDAPIAHGLVAITGGYLGRDLRQGPRTLEALGLLHHSPAQLREMLHEGEGA